jgi:hypothetical protein
MGHEFVPDKICVNPVWVLGNYTLIIFIVMVNGAVMVMIIW